MKPMDKEQQHQEDLQRIRGFRLIDDDFMRIFFDGYIEGAELLIKVILQRDDIKVDEVRTQKELKNIKGRSVWLDISPVWLMQICSKRVRTLVICVTILWFS